MAADADNHRSTLLFGSGSICWSRGGVYLSARRSQLSSSTGSPPVDWPSIACKSRDAACFGRFDPTADIGRSACQRVLCQPGRNEQLGCCCAIGGWKSFIHCSTRRWQPGDRQSDARPLIRLHQVLATICREPRCSSLGPSLINARMWIRPGCAISSGAKIRLAATTIKGGSVSFGNPFSRFS